jgi:hypothetical protein
LQMKYQKRLTILSILILQMQLKPTKK